MNWSSVLEEVYIYHYGDKLQEAGSRTNPTSHNRLWSMLLLGIWLKPYSEAEHQGGPVSKIEPNLTQNGKP